MQNLFQSLGSKFAEGEVKFQNLRSNSKEIQSSQRVEYNKQAEAVSRKVDEDEAREEKIAREHSSDTKSLLSPLLEHASDSDNSNDPKNGANAYADPTTNNH